MTYNDNKLTACVLIIGNEILSGRTQDINLNFIANTLRTRGIAVKECRVIPDDESVIIDTVNECRQRYGLVFTTGGIGPTHDDITAACIAKAFGRPLVTNPEALALLENYYSSNNFGGMTDVRARMALMPEDSTLLLNPISSAPGFNVENVYVLPGVPRIMQGIFQLLLPSLPMGKPIMMKSVSAFMRESLIAKTLTEIQHAHPETDIGSYPAMKDGQPFLSLVAKGTDEQNIDQVIEKIKQMLISQGASPLTQEQV